MKHFKGYVPALMNLFPNIGLIESKFPNSALCNLSFIHYYHSKLNY